MSRTLELLAATWPTHIPVGNCQICEGLGPLKELKNKRETVFACIPCVIDRGLS